MSHKSLICNGLPFPNCHVEFSSLFVLCFLQWFLWWLLSLFVPCINVSIILFLNDFVLCFFFTLSSVSSRFIFSWYLAITHCCLGHLVLCSYFVFFWYYDYVLKVFSFFVFVFSYTVSSALWQRFFGEFSLFIAKLYCPFSSFSLWFLCVEVDRMILQLLVFEWDWF